MKFNLNNPKGKRLTEVFVKRGSHLEPVEEHKKYMIATNSFVGFGKNNFNGFKTVRVIHENLELDIKFLSDYLSTLHQPIHYEIESRIT